MFIGFCTFIFGLLVLFAYTSNVYIPNARKPSLLLCQASHTDHACEQYLTSTGRPYFTPETENDLQARIDALEKVKSAIPVAHTGRITAIDKQIANLQERANTALSKADLIPPTQ